MIHSDTPQTPQTPTPPTASPIEGTTSLTVERTVTTNGQDAPQTPQTPTPPTASPIEGTTSLTVERTVTTNEQDASQASGSPAIHPADIVPMTSSGASMTDMFKPNTLLQVQLGISTIQIDGETIIHDHLRNSNYRLNPSGSFIWSHISQQISFADLLVRIHAAHNIVPESVDKMVSEFLGEMVQIGVLAVVTPAP